MVNVVEKDQILPLEPLNESTPFDISKWASEQVGHNNKVLNITSYSKRKDFKQICKIIRDELKELVDNSDDQSLLEKQHEAVIGKPEAMGYFIDKVTEVLRKRNITSEDFPSFYNSLAEAVFHEVWGLSILMKWENQYPDSEACGITGTELWIDINGEFVKQEEEFESEAHVERIKRAFTLRQADAVINAQSPELEIEKENGDRITMVQKPRAREFYMMFRRFVIADISLEEQANRGTIRQEDIPIFRALSRTKPNTMLVGRVKSAKSTFMKSMIRERHPKEAIAVLEKHFELRLKDHMKDRLIFEMQAKEGDLHQAVPRLLRMEHDFIVIGEIRSIEMEGFMEACERGERGAFSTYHLTDIKNVVPQLGRHLLDEYPNRTPEIEFERVARNLDIVITLTRERRSNKKRVIGVSEVIWDDDSKTYYTTDLIRYSNFTKKYYYSSKISKRLLFLMLEEDPEETKVLYQLLKEREAESPMSEYRDLQESDFNALLNGEN